MIKKNATCGSFLIMGQKIYWSQQKIGLVYVRQKIKFNHFLADQKQLDVFFMDRPHS